MDKIFHVELQTPKRSSEDVEKDLAVFEEFYPGLRDRQLFAKPGRHLRQHHFFAGFVLY